MFKKNSGAPEHAAAWGSEAERAAEMDARWPRDAFGSREQAVFVAHIPDINNEIDLAVNMLSAYGIPAFKSYGNEGALGKLLIGTSAYSPSLYVPASMAEDARALLESPAEDAAEDLESSGAEEPPRRF